MYVSTSVLQRGLCVTEKDHREPWCQRLGGGAEPEKLGFTRVGGCGVWLHGDRTARLLTAPAQPAQLQASSLGRI